MGAGCSSSSSSHTASEPEPQPAKKADSVNVAETSTSAAQSNVETTASPQGTAKGGTEGVTRRLTILHFNDVYNIEEQDSEPKGGASRLCAKVKEYRQRGSNPLVLFSGDAYNPSLMSTVTLGKQMVDVLNGIGVNVSCVGNHDFDYGLENLRSLNAQCSFPWLMANVLARGTETPFGGAGTVWVEEWNGVKVGVVGLVEEEWLETLGAVNVADMEYRDFIQVGREAARELKAKGAELLIALTHMREPNDRKLAAEVPEFHLILGGHDHHYVTGFIEPHNNLLVKSGTDFRDLSVVEVELPAGASSPMLRVERVPIDSSVPEDPDMKKVVEEHMKVLGEKMDMEIGETLEPLDGRFQTVRNRESNLGNFVADVWRKAARADIAVLNGGSLRSDKVHPAGPLRSKDLMSILPILTETLVLECSGAQVVAALENGVSQWPKLEGRFPQVSGIKFKFDPSLPPGQRIVPGSVLLTEAAAGTGPGAGAEGGGDGPALQPLAAEGRYRVAVTDYLAKGRDGFDVFTECKVLVDGEAGVVVPSALRYHLLQMQVVNSWNKDRADLQAAASTWLRKAATSKDAEKLQAGEGADDEPEDKPRSQFGMRALQEAQRRTHGLAVVHPERGHLVIAPLLEGRIVNVQEEQQQQGAAEGGSP